MKSLKPGSAIRPADLADPNVMTEALSNWSDLAPEVLRAIERDPRHGPRLEMLRAADRALESMGRGREELGPCPDAEELYDYGRGPGYALVTKARRVEIDAHVARCMDCEFYVETLAVPPPLPLELERLHVGGGDGDERFAEPRERAVWRDGDSTWVGDRTTADAFRKRSAVRRMAVLATAAAVLATGAVWLSLRGGGEFSLHVPPEPVLRGDAGGPLYFPRERVLAPTDALRTAWPLFDGTVMFELAPVPGATEYRIEVSRHGDDVFAVGTPIASQRTTTPQAHLDLAASPGRYTWEAWAVIDGLNRKVGARDFQVVDDAELSATLAEIAAKASRDGSSSRDSASSTERARAVEILHAKGFLSDARAVARELSPSAERDAYLARIPGR